MVSAMPQAGTTSSLLQLPLPAADAAGGAADAAGGGGNLADHRLWSISEIAYSNGKTP